MLNLKIAMAPEKEQALRQRVAKHGGSMSRYLLDYMNLIADGAIELVPQVQQPQRNQKLA